MNMELNKKEPFTEMFFRVSKEKGAFSVAQPFLALKRKRT